MKKQLVHPSAKIVDIDMIDPSTVQVKVVDLPNISFYNNLDEARAKFGDLTRFIGPISDKHKGVSCVRFDTPQSHRAFYF